jgi:hypothetical protein
MYHYHRGERRYQRRRMIDKFFKQESRYSSRAEEESWAMWRARQRAKCRTPCSCTMCASPRKLYGNGTMGLTFQEVRFLARLKDEE